jgi:hypothetical protein
VGEKLEAGDQLENQGVDGENNVETDLQLVVWDVVCIDLVRDRDGWRSV